jgi:hypothetical protein
MAHVPRPANLAGLPWCAPQQCPKKDNVNVFHLEIPIIGNVTCVTLTSSASMLDVTVLDWYGLRETRPLSLVSTCQLDESRCGRWRTTRGDNLNKLTLLAHYFVTGDVGDETYISHRKWWLKSTPLMMLLQCRTQGNMFLHTSALHP